MIWIPPWLARAYARLYLAKRGDTFDFSEAGRILGLDDKVPIAKALAKLRSFGYLTSRRDPVDPRRKLFKLIDAQSVVLAMGIQSSAKSDELTEKLRAASGSLDYYLNGAYAAYQYHRYSAPGRIDVSVRVEQMPAWIALLSGKGVALSIDDVPAERPAEHNIHIRSDFEEKLSEHVRTIDGINYLAPEILVTLGIARENPGMDDVLAILVVQRTKLDWRRLIELSDAYGATRFTGCILDVLNFESRRPLFEKSVIARLFKRSKLDATLDFPQNLSQQPVERLYEDISAKWNIRLHLTHAQASKIVTDLVRR